MSEDSSELNAQAITLAHHFVHQVPSADIIKRYVTVVSRRPSSDLSPADTRLIDYGFRHSALLPALDAGLALIRPDAELRRRIYCMFAILEATPEYSHKFLAVRRSPLYLIFVGLVGIRAVLRAMTGIVFIKVLQV